MKIEVGKYYRTRDGEIVGPMERNHGAKCSVAGFPFGVPPFNGGNVWMEDGRFFVTGSDRDLIEEVPAPAHAAAKPAIKVKTTKTAELTVLQVADAIRAYVGAGDGSSVTVSGDGDACVTWTVEGDQ